jgi:type IV pilus assembly protein PilC
LKAFELTAYSEGRLANPFEIQERLRKDREIQTRAKQGAFSIRNPLGRTVRSREIAEFTRQLATMVQARLPLTRSLEILVRQQKNRGFKAVLQEVLDAVKAGKPFSESLSGYPRIFSPLYVNMTAVGEMSGNMPEILNQLSIYQEKMSGLRRKVTTAMTYPAVILLVAAGALSFLMFGVMPTFTDMFNDFGARMPLPARILLGTADFLRRYAILIPVLAAAGIASFRVYHRTETGRRKTDALKFRIPLVGSIYRKTAVARFSRTLGTLLSSGVSLIDALDVTARSCGNVVIEGKIREMRRSASRGEALEASISNDDLIPELVVQMIAVGEETAELPSMLTRTAEYYESEVDSAVEALTSVIEPVIIVVLGVIIGGTIITIYLQIFDLMNAIQ